MGEVTDPEKNQVTYLSTCDGSWRRVSKKKGTLWFHGKEDVFPLLQDPRFLGYDVDPLLRKEVVTMMETQVFQKIP